MKKLFEFQNKSLYKLLYLNTENSGIVFENQKNKESKFIKNRNFLILIRFFHKLGVLGF